MAIYHCSMKPISRGSGKSMVAAAAYRHTCKLKDTRTGEVHDYSRKSGLEFSGIYLPNGVTPEWALDREKLWNAVEASEKRKNSCVGREIVLALPSELSQAKRCELAGEMASYLANRYGLAVDVAIHQPGKNGDERNYHAHMLMSSRRITPEGFGEKARELDDMKVRGPLELERIRAEWERLANHSLEEVGQSARIDHRSFRRQGLKRMPTLHLGVSATAMERRGVQTRLGERNRVAQEINSRVIILEQEQRQLEEQTHPRPRISDVREGMANFANGFAAHKKEAEEQEQRKQEEKKRAEARRHEVNKRLADILQRTARERGFLEYENVYAAYFKVWSEKNRPPWKLSALRQADEYIAVKMLSEGRDANRLKDALYKRSPAVGLARSTRDESDGVVDRAMNSQEVQSQLREALEKQKNESQQRQRDRVRMR